MEKKGSICPENMWVKQEDLFTGIHGDSEKKNNNGGGRGKVYRDSRKAGEVLVEGLIGKRGSIGHCHPKQDD